MKRRADSAFGLHFDFHANPATGAVVGATLKEEDIREICREIRPDFIQVDCKGHPGWASYPTELENPMPRFAMDTLALWRRVTKEEGVALYLHYSGVIDRRFCEHHPGEAIMNPPGTRSDAVTRVAGHYADMLLIPQLKELAGKYGADGVWVDGECWGTAADYDPETVAAFEKETGIDLGGELPVKPGDPHFEEYREFCRELFRRYVRHYVDEVHREYPDFQIASNWAYTDHMPEPVTSNVDFLSGDFNPSNSFNVARYAGRAIAQQNMTWDLMAWNFRSGHGDLKLSGVPKHPVQIMQEAAAVLSLGGGFQNYITQYPDGSPRMEQIRRMKDVGAFVRAREPYCFRGKAEHNAVILLSTHDRALEHGNLWGRTGYERTVGLTALMCDAGQPVEIACEHTLRGRCADWGLIAVPELKYGLDDAMKAELLAYAENGGSLLLTGPFTCRTFAKDLPGVTVDDSDQTDRQRWLTVDGEYTGILKDAHAVTAEGAETVGRIGDAERETNLPGAVILPYGKGKIAMIAADIGTQYGICVQYIHRDLIRTLAERLYTPAVRIEKALGLLEVGILVKDGKRFVQLVNANGSHASRETATEDFIPPVLDVTLSVAAEKKPAALILQPEGRRLDFTWSDGRITVTVPRIDLYDIMEIED